jgi:hypothetical protein
MTPVLLLQMSRQESNCDFRLQERATWPLFAAAPLKEERKESRFVTPCCESDKFDSSFLTVFCELCLPHSLALLGHEFHRHTEIYGYGAGAKDAA